MAILSLFCYNPYVIILRTDACRRRARATAPSFLGLSAVAQPGPVPVSPGRRGPKIARDDY